MYRIHMLPAEFGDSLLIEFGRSKTKPKRILIDAGTPGSWTAVKNKIASLPADQRAFELLVVTHIDADHIGGVLPLLRDAKKLGVTFNDIWFNGYKHLTDLLGPKQGEELSRRIEAGGYAWNEAFDGQAVVVSDEGGLPEVDVAGMSIKLLSPKRVQLENLEKEWREVIEAAGLVPGVPEKPEPEVDDDTLGEESIDIDELATSRFRSDTAKANGSSIAFVASYGGKSVLFGADAFPGVLLDSIDRLSTAERNKIAMLKLPHHGSRNNISSDLVKAVGCDRFLVSTNGKRFRHPDREAIARVIHEGGKPSVFFNYRTEFNELWDDRDLSRAHKYKVQYGEDGELTIDV